MILVIGIACRSLIYIIISKNIRYLLSNRGARRFFHDTYLTIEVQGIRCTNHLHDSCPLTDVNPHFPLPGADIISKLTADSPIVTSSTRGPAASYCGVTIDTYGPAASYCDVTMIHYSHRYLWTHDTRVKGIAITCEALNCLAHDFIILQFNSIQFNSIFIVSKIADPRARIIMTKNLTR